MKDSSTWTALPDYMMYRVSQRVSLLKRALLLTFSSRLGYLNCFLSYILTRTVAPPQSEAWEGRDCPWRPLCR